MTRRTVLLVVLVLWLSGCSSPASLSKQVESPQTTAVVAAQEAAQKPPSAETHKEVPAAVIVDQPPAPTAAAETSAAVPAATATTVPTAVEVELPTAAAVVAEAQAAPPSDPAAPVSAAVGPDEFPAGVSPLTGLPVDDPSTLALAPALVSITNFPITARPQAGLSSSPFVFEMYIGEGMTRFLGLFYGDYPKASGEQPAGVSGTNDGVGPIRSGRLPYESLRQLYNGFLVMASASPNVKSSLAQAVNVFGSDESDINSALIPVEKLKQIATNNSSRLDPLSLTGMQFDPAVKPEGKTAQMLWIPFNYLNQVLWRYDAATGAYLRYQDNADGETFTQATDRLNGEPLTYENVVVLFANHHARAETLIDLDLMYQGRTPALLFRDGKMYEIFWTTANGEYEKTSGHVRPIRFVDSGGNPVAFKPGQTWVEIVPAYTPYNETVDPGTYFDMKKKVSPGSGNWAIKFAAPAIEK